MKNMEHFHEMKSLTRKQKFCLLSLIPAYFIVIGLVVQPLQEIVPGIVNIIRVSTPALIKAAPTPPTTK